MKRRYFLSITGLFSGACLIPPSVAQRIKQIGSGLAQPGILSPENPCGSIYAIQNYSDSAYTLYMGHPSAEPDYPTLEDFIEMKGYDSREDAALKKFFLEWRESELDEGETVTKEHLRQLRTEFDTPIEGSERSHWLDWDYEMHESPMAQAYHFMENLPLSSGEFDEHNHDVLGELSFVEGDQPGSNLTYCEAYGAESIAAIQHRLNELKTGMQVVIGQH
ncbi:MAG: hypothetical protein KJO21_08925 [Verrucomicrobiae bacterium]|nr:hypothetical protein [Verrucomicrobiae bacterium]NNJ42296.1 hypothetical protein [Akkermansiaceae bacterium]